MNFYQQSVEQVVQQLKTNIENGLTQDEVIERQNRSILKSKQRFALFPRAKLLAKEVGNTASCFTAKQRVNIYEISDT